MKLSTKIAIGTIAAAAIAVVTPGGVRWAKDRQMRNIQKAARADLDLLLRAEREFHRERGFYTTDLGSLPFKQKDLKSVLYKFGFTSPSGPDLRGPASLDPDRADIGRLKSSRPDLEIALSPATKLESIDFATLSRFCPDCTATAEEFKAVAAANLDDDAVLDVWTIDSRGQIRHLIDDLR